MSILDASLRKTWDSLRARKQVQNDFLDEVRLKGLRGIRNLRVAFDYPVSVVAGPNGCGKSTVLFACAAAYAPRGRSARAYTPAALFPGFSGGGGAGGFVDEAGGTALEFYYLAGGARYSMVWRKGRSWSRSFMGRKDVRQPERALYLRTLANLTNPSEVRGLLQLGRGTFDAEEITSDLLLFARRILPQKYRGVSLLRGRNRDILFAGLDHHNAVGYSEFHMSAGERAILRMSKDISSLTRALILIDEIEAGLHPWTQQQLMLELQRIALRNDLQVVVTTHSAVVLDSVPPEGRIFLERDATTLDVTRQPAWRDIFQKALYGQSTDRLSILCEDEVAEGVILGVLDVLNYWNGTRHDDFVVGRDTGSDEFRGHIHAFGKFGKLAGFVFVLDGDAADKAPAMIEAAGRYGHKLDPLFLPGRSSPEAWIWNAVRDRPDEYAREYGLTAQDLRARLASIEQMFAGDATTRPQDVPKAMVMALADELTRAVPEIARIAGRLETEAARGEMAAFSVGLTEQIDTWRQAGAH